MISKFVKNKEIEIYAEGFGDPKNPCMMLLMGATAQGLMWDEKFCNALASSGYFVIRYDNRDTGKSSKINYEQNPYYIHDLAEDALLVLKAFGFENAHWIAASMGSFVAQIIATFKPEYVKKLILIMSSPNHEVFIEGFKGFDSTHSQLPASHPKLLEYYKQILSISSTSPDEALKQYHDIQKRVIGAPEHLEHARIAEGRILKRLKSKYHVHNHAFALANSKNIHDKLDLITHDTLIIHGKEDYILPVEHGRLLAQCIKNSKYIEYEHMGHCFSEEIFKKLAEDIIHFVLT